MGYALEHLGPARCREIAEGLFRVEKVYGTKLHGFCPVHKPEEKNASAFYNWEMDAGGCKSCNEKWDLVKLWCLVNGYDPQDVKAFKAEFDLGNDTDSRKKPATGQPARPKTPPPPQVPDVFVAETELQALPPLSGELATMLAEKRRWTPQVIAALDLREFVDAKKNKRIAIPIRDEEGRLGNIRLYQPGAEQFKVISWFDKTCPHCGGTWQIVKKMKTCKACGKGPNDYGRTRLFPPPQAWQPGRLFLCEGEPDTICALSHGLNAVTQTAGCGTWREEFSQAMAGRDVVICYDADSPGFKGAHVAADCLVNHAKSVRILVWPELMGAAE